MDEVRRAAVIAAAAAVAAAVLIGWVVVAPGPAAPQPGAVSLHGGQVLSPVGAVLRVPGFSGVYFDVPSGGGQLVGEAVADHTSVGFIEAFTVGAVFNCPVEAPGYWGGPWTYVANQTLPAGAFIWGAVCGTAGNITVTQAIEILYNG